MSKAWRSTAGALWAQPVSLAARCSPPTRLRTSTSGQAMSLLLLVVLLLVVVLLLLLLLVVLLLLLALLLVLLVLLEHRRQRNLERQPLHSS